MGLGRRSQQAMRPAFLVIVVGALLTLATNTPTYSNDDLIMFGSGQALDPLTQDLAELNEAQAVAPNQIALLRQKGEPGGSEVLRRQLTLSSGESLDVESRAGEQLTLLAGSPDQTTLASRSQATTILTALTDPVSAGKVDADVTAEFAAGQEEVPVIVEVESIKPQEADDSQAEQQAKQAQAEQTEQRLDQTLGSDGDVATELDLQLASAVAATVDEQGLAKLAADPEVKRIELDGQVKAVLDTSLEEIHARQAWTSFDRSNNGLTGVGRRIAIIDTGVNYRHPDLGGCFGPNCKVIDGYDFVNHDPDPLDDHGHGTHVASTAAGKGALYGVAPDAQILAYKVLSRSGSGSFSSVIAAIDRATDPNGDGDTSDHVDVVNMSLGGSGNPDDAVSRAVDRSSAAGVVHAIAAGNSGPGPSTIGTPGVARSAITVAAACKRAQVGTGYCASPIASFSSRGPVLWRGQDLQKPDVAAPGVSICAAWISAGSCAGGSTSTVRLSGTSMATPHVAGAALLTRQANPDFDPNQIKLLLRSTAQSLGGSLTPAEQGAGLINLAAAIPSSSRVTASPATWAVTSDPTAKQSESSQTFSIRTDSAASPIDVTFNLAYAGLTLGADATRLDLTAEGVATVRVTVTIDNDTVPTGTYQGSIVLAQGSVTKGIIPLTIVVKPTISIAESTIDYGINSPGLATWVSAPKTVTVRNLRTDVAQTVTPTTVGFPASVTVRANGNLLVPAGGTGTLTTTLETANQSLGNGIHHGDLLLTAGQTRLALPASFTKFYVLTIADPTSSLVGGSVWVHDRQSSQYLRWMGSAATTFYLGAPGPYDVIAVFPQQFDSNGRHSATVFREGINLTEGTAAVEVRRSDATYAVDLEPTNARGEPVGKLIDATVGISYQPRSSLNLTTILSGYGSGSPDVSTQYYSAVSPSYRVVHEFFDPPHETARDVHLYYDTFQGLSASQTTRNQATDFRSTKLTPNVNRLDGLLAPRLTTCILSFPCFSQYPYTAVELPLVQTIHALPAPTAAFPSDSRLTVLSDARRTGCPLSGEVCHSQFLTPWLSLSGASWRFFDPLPGSVPSVLTSGLGPVFPSLKFLNRRQTVNLYPYFYAPKSVFLRQDMSVGESEVTPYRITDPQGKVVLQGVFPRFVLDGNVSPSAPQGPYLSTGSARAGFHEFHIDSFRYKSSNQLLAGSFVAKFVLGSSDPNPPVLRTLALTSNGVRTDQYTAGAPSTLELTIDPLGGTVGDVRIRSAADGGSLTAQVVQHQSGGYRAELPQLPVASKVTLQIEAFDSAGNSFVYTVDIPANLDTVKPTTSFENVEPGSFLVGTKTIRARADDNKRIAKVELYRGSELLGSATAAPYEVPWNTKSVADGYYTLQLRATDTTGNVSTRDVSVTVDNTPPVVYGITSPVGSVGRGIVTLQTSQYDTFGIAKVEYSIDGRIHDTAGQYPYTRAWDTRQLAHDSAHELSATVYDLAGNVTTSNPQRVVIYDPPAPEPARPTPVAATPAPSAPSPLPVAAAPVPVAKPSVVPASGSGSSKSAEPTQPQQKVEAPPAPPRELRSLSKKEQQTKVTLERKVRSAEGQVRAFERKVQNLQGKIAQLESKSQSTKIARQLRIARSNLGKAEQSLNGARDNLGRVYGNLDRLIYK